MGRGNIVQTGVRDPRSTPARLRLRLCARDRRVTLRETLSERWPATAQVSGQWKRNAPALGAVLAIVEAGGGGGAFEVRAGLPGKLLEVNQRVAADPRLLSERPEADGYLAVLQPPAKELRALRQRTEVF